MQEPYHTDPAQEICATAVDHADYTDPTRQRELQYIIQIKTASALKGLDHDVRIDHTDHADHTDHLSWV